MRSHDVAEKGDRSRMGHQRCGLVVCKSARPCKRVIDTRICIRFDVLVAGKGGPDLLARCFGHELIGGGEMQHQRAFYLRHEVKGFFDPDTIVADRAVNSDMGGCKIGERSAQTKAERPDLAGTFRTRLKRRHARDDVIDRFGDIELLIEGESLLELDFIEFDARVPAAKNTGAMTT